MADADFYLINARFGYFVQTENAPVFLAATQQTVVLHAKANTWSGRQTFL
jgi:hypothetical protein